MRTFKASKKNRTNYTYHFLTGKPITITPDKVGDDWIATLHTDDDAIIDADRREKYHVPISYDAYVSSDGESDFNREKIECMEDTTPDPLERIMEAMDEQEHTEKLERLRATIQTLQPQQIDLIYKVFYAKRTNWTSQRKKDSRKCTSLHPDRRQNPLTLEKLRKEKKHMDKELPPTVIE